MAAALAGSLPERVTTFVGRVRELEAVRGALESSRLVTLTGPGGVGKTSLALQTAAGARPGYAAGAYFVDLTSLSGREAIEDTITKVVGSDKAAATLGVSSHDRLVDFLRPLHLLLVLDNCEHVVADVGPLVTTLRDECPELTVLATSREPLGLLGERTVQVQPMSLPEHGGDINALGGADAVVLFCDRAQAVRADFALRPDNAQVIAELCVRLDGIPLAIELAAARTGSLSPADVLERLHERFRLLVTDVRGATERHRTLRGTIDWSFQLLDETERTMLLRCAVFAGSFDLAAVEHACTDGDLGPMDVIELLSNLVNKSLVVVSELGGQTRYRMLESIGVFAKEMLESSGELEMMQARHAAYFRDFAAAAGAGLRTSEQLSWIPRVQADAENMRLAIAWALDTFRVTIATDMVAPFLMCQSPLDATFALWAEMVAGYPHPEHDPRLPGVVSFLAFVRFFHRGETDATETVAQALQATQRTRDQSLRACVLAAATALAALTDWDYTALAIEQLELTRQMGDPFLEVISLSALTWSGVFSGVDRTEDAQDAVRVANRTQNPTSLLLSKQALAVSIMERDPEQAVRLLDESIELAVSLGDGFGRGVSETMRSNLITSALDPVAALRLMLGSVESALHGQMRGVATNWFEEVAALLGMNGQDDAAAIVMGRVQRRINAIGPYTHQEYQAELDAIVVRLGQPRYDELLARGAGMSDEEAIEVARARLDQL